MKRGEVIHLTTLLVMNVIYQVGDDSGEGFPLSLLPLLSLSPPSPLLSSLSPSLSSNGSGDGLLSCTCVCICERECVCVCV